MGWAFSSNSAGIRIKDVVICAVLGRVPAFGSGLFGKIPDSLSKAPAAEPGREVDSRVAQECRIGPVLSRE